MSQLFYVSFQQLDENYLPWSFICILIHPSRQMISYKELVTVGSDLSLTAFAFITLKNSQYV